MDERGLIWYEWVMNKETRGAYYLVFLTSLAGLVGSLYFSEIRHFIPCVLCWWQRITLYPIVVLSAVGILRQDKNLPYYILPLSLIGGAVSIYHNLLQYGVISEKLAPCTVGASCTAVYINYFGFITIPLLSLLAFAFISGLMLAVIKRGAR
jgi:disulfide bond formation protein DsbB